MAAQAGGPTDYSMFDPNQFISGASGLIGGLFGNSGAPYSAASEQYQDWSNKAAGAQQPFYNAGVGAIGDYQSWLKGMQDPSKFVNNTMNQYQESPWAKYQQQQSIRSANNLGSATGMNNSTPMQQQAQQNAQNISSGDMSTWMQQVLGINSQYGQGTANMMGMGANSANALTNMYGQFGEGMAQSAYGEQAGNNSDQMADIAGMAMMAMAFL